MKISVIIPVYNEEKYLEKCLLSLKNQIEKPDEIIIIDNNCTDRTIEIARKFTMKIIQEKKQGMAFARNCGFNHATGDIIARTDADVILPSNWIKKIKKSFEKNNIDALTGPVIFYDLPFSSSIYAKLYFWFMKLISKTNIIAGPNMILTKKVWEKVKDKVCLDDRKIHEDIDLSIHLEKIGGIIKKDDSLIVKASGRRIKLNPFSFFLEYPVRTVRTLRIHK